jgi:hypothetical protein
LFLRKEDQGRDEEEIEDHKLAVSKGKVESKPTEDDQKKLRRLPRRGRERHYSKQDKNAPPQPAVEGRGGGEATQSPASAPAKAQLGIPPVWEGRCAKGNPGIQDGIHRLKLTGTDGRGWGPTVRLTEHSGSAP